MRTRLILVLVATNLATCASAQQPVITSFLPNGTILWTNISTNCMAVVEELSPSTTNEWTAIHSELVTALVASAQLATTSSHAWFRVANSNESIAPPGMVLIPAGAFAMGEDASGNESPRHEVTLSSFYMGEREVTKAQWDEVYGWAVTNSYSFSIRAVGGKGPDHPVQNVEWYDAVKWCNARSEMEGLTPCYYTDAAQTEGDIYRSGRVGIENDWVRWDADGYRLPTEAEWEKAARGGAEGWRFPWSDADTISHSRANYYALQDSGYDESFPAGFHPDYDTDPWPYTSPVGSFLPNGYGLYDMAGNVWEWCWDRFGYYSAPPTQDPRGPDSGLFRVCRGGSWYGYSNYCRVANRVGDRQPADNQDSLGFRLARAAP